MYELERRQIIAAAPEKLWDFFSRPANLEKLMPSQARFKAVGELASKMHEAQEVSFRFDLFPGIRLGWTSIIEDIREGHSFADRQLQGPFGYWRHEHIFEPHPEGTEIIDRLRYRLPLEPFSKLFHRIIVKNKIEEIFDERQSKLKDLMSMPDQV